MDSDRIIVFDGVCRLCVRSITVIMQNDSAAKFKFAPMAVEVRKNSEPLTTFEHPRRPLYVFGPEDGSLPKAPLRHCQRFVIIPSRHCLNLGNAVNVILYDRVYKMDIRSKSDIP